MGKCSTKRMQKIFPGREVVEIVNSDPVFHTVFDLDNRGQVPGQWSLGGRAVFK